MPVLVLLPTLLLLYTGYTLPRQLHQLQRELQSQLKFQEISADIYHLTTSVQEYIFYGDLQALNNFRQYSAQMVNKELELYNLVEQSKKQDVAQLMALSKAYNSFVEREVIPGRQLEANENRELLLWQYRDLSRQLVDRADALRDAGLQENNALLEYTVALLNKEGLFMLLLSLFSLGAVIWEVVAARQWLAHYFCLRSLAKDSPDAIMFVDRKERLQYVNRSAANLFHVPKEAVAGKSLGEILTMYPHLQSIVQPLYDALLQNEKITDYQLSYGREEGKLLLTVDCTPIYLFKKPAGAVLVARKTPEPKNSNILLDTIERERKRLSIEIHDWIGRYMSSIIHGLDYVLRVNGGRLPAEVQENLLMLRTQCQNAAIDMRGIMNDIHPYLIEKVGLIPALESYSTNFERIHNKKVYIFYRQRSLQLDREKEILVYRIIQEALTNVAKHSPATEVDIHFSETKDTLQIEIVDNGGGQETAPVPGKGLWGMKERARLIGGDLVYGFVDGGFCVTLTLPKAGGGKADGQDRHHAGGRP
ncbi:PAS domain [Moorella glycerini]|uniref:histidine kinase n=2 Tax=Neomoorella stamsii TaxID=1266720 RepID=A0A9X7J5F2_9FIRM|nr:Signal transduction histidine-protein kinase/phosphatase DegS [Moorella stamsii]CEP68529.1 PAS domain [Moorella glycerini]